VLTAAAIRLEGVINKMNDTIANLKKENGQSNEKIKQLENELANGKKLRSENSSENSNSLPLVKKYYNIFNFLFQLH
jgi:predicted nuclease with TOPRIM domain